ncbi:MAG: glycosyltransferase family 4 protein [Anaerolineales bacterium]
MRIGVNCYLLQPHIGGLKQYFFTLFRELVENDTENEYILFWYPHNADELAKLQTDKWRANAVQLTNQLQVLAHLDRLDVYFCPFSALYPRPVPKPAVMTLVDIQEQYFPEFFTVEDLYNRDFHFPVSTRLADRVVTISEFSKCSLVQHHRLSADKVVVACLSADEGFYQSERLARAPQAELPADFIFCPANFWKHKNHDRLLQAVKLLRDQKQLSVPVVFTGFEQANGYPLREKVAEYGLQAQTQILGYVTREEIAYLYRRARMLVFPSLFEGFGIPLVEAMASGCPVVASNTTSIPEVVLDAAELFDPLSPASIAEAIGKVWQNRDWQQTLVARGHRRAQYFSATRTAAAHVRAFEEAVRVYSYPRYLWNHWVYDRYHSFAVRLRWQRRRGGRRFALKWLMDKIRRAARS